MTTVRSLQSRRCAGTPQADQPLHRDEQRADVLPLIHHVGALRCGGRVVDRPSSCTGPWPEGNEVTIPEVSRLAATVRRWQAEILAGHTTSGASNGPTEAVNPLIKKIKRVGHGFRNLDNYRLRLLLHCGVTWHTPRAASIRSRAPRSAA